MKHVLLSIAFLAGLILLCGNPAVGQKRSTVPQDNRGATKRLEDDLQAQVRQQLFLRVTYALRATCEDARTWKDAVTAAKVQAMVADLLWESEPDSVRYLIQAWETTGRVRENEKERSSYRNYSARNDVRRAVLLVARKRAPVLAKQWLEEMTKEATTEKETQSRGAFDDRTARSSVLLQMAFQIASDNPQAAAEMSIESLQDGVSFGFQEVLLKLQENNFDVAQTVFRAALARLRTFGLTDPNELLILYSYLYTPGRVLAPATSDNRGNIQLAVGRNRPHIVAAAGQLNPALATEFLGLAADLLLALPLPASTTDPQLTARTQISVISTLLTEMIKQVPEKGLALRARALQIDADARFSTEPNSSRPDLPERRDGEKSPDYLERRVDALEEAAQKESSSLGRDIAYAKAALATTVERYERGLDLAHKIDDESLRAGVSNWLIYRATLHLIDKGDYEKAYRLNSKSTEPLQRAACLVAGSQKSVKEKQEGLVRARQWLEEARAVTAHADAEENRSRVAFGIVATYGQFDRAMALQSLSEAVRWLNQTDVVVKNEDRAPLIKRFSGFTNLSDFTYGTKGFSFETALRVFGSEQFEEVLSIINTISAREMRGIGVVLFCEQNLKAVLPRDVGPPTTPGK
jgi:hypothetical protein